MEENGYIVFKNLISNELCEKIENEMFEKAAQHFKIFKNKKETWKEVPFHGLLNLWHLKSLYELRQDKKIYNIFCQFLETKKLICSLDRVCMKPPCRDSSETNENKKLHTDLNYWFSTPEKAGYQGGLCLSDCPEGGGGFYCIPGFNKREKIEKYKKDFENKKFGKHTPPKQKNKFNMFEDMEVTKNEKIEIVMNKGDFVVWSSNLPHAGGVNTLRKHWRLHTYVRFVPLEGNRVDKILLAEHKDYKNVVKKSVTTGIRPEKFSTGNVVSHGGGSTEVEKQEFLNDPPIFTELGKKIFGIEEY
eukprot:TRINITY_DN762_c0_g1_i1.p1 TRINITY_DN762_c0_g1~~TRINITY_DN762_c0_g1_i1.p1  ORF type:complete len:328 (-),score=95.37 TRINITY_DN762_c0_g1_i1:49-957(-)